MFLCYNFILLNNSIHFIYILRFYICLKKYITQIVFEKKIIILKYYRAPATKTTPIIHYLLMLRRLIKNRRLWFCDRGFVFFVLQYKGVHVGFLNLYFNNKVFKLGFLNLIFFFRYYLIDVFLKKC